MADIVVRLNNRASARLSLRKPNALDHYDAGLDIEAATEIDSLRASNAKLRDALERADETLDQILDDMRDGGLCVCLAVKNEAIDTLSIVRAALATAPAVPPTSTDRDSSAGEESTL